MSHFYENGIFYRFFKNPQISNLMKNCPVGAELLHAYRLRTDLMKLLVTYHNFANAP